MQQNKPNIGIVWGSGIPSFCREPHYGWRNDCVASYYCYCYCYYWFAITANKKGHIQYERTTFTLFISTFFSLHTQRKYNHIEGVAILPGGIAKTKHCGGFDFPAGMELGAHFRYLSFSGHIKHTHTKFQNITFYHGRPRACFASGDKSKQHVQGGTPVQGNQYRDRGAAVGTSQLIAVRKSTLDKNTIGKYSLFLCLCRWRSQLHCNSLFSTY